MKSSSPSKRRLTDDRRKSDTSALKRANKQLPASDMDDEQKNIEILKKSLQNAQSSENNILSQIYSLENQLNQNLAKLKLSNTEKNQVKDIEKSLQANYQLRNKILSIYNDRNIKIENSKKELSDLKFRLKGIEDQRFHREQEIDQLQSQADEMNEKMQEIEHSMNELKCTYETFQHQVELAQQQVNNKEAEKAKLLEEKQSLIEELEQSKKAAEKHRKENEKIISDLKAQIEQIKTENEETKKQIEQTTEKQNTIESKIDETNIEIKNYNDEMFKILETLKFYSKEIQTNEFNI
ncbi:hypothetical protein TVAG_528810 [Trichomonas vaginalis G3]|uniref:Uncharacterized protein n=1 Tax=Trichomonas vaginalis (strain ATCC PRA-98 / G3) TaxID=412133 RepID=A2G975_TRIV3|nr:hypothetical protein TVAGG3_0054990 [Trichomonas vaginalis G3]EAX86290.1 hypothetical protein TVAG_528810 [Trichomonas vaginalis G3]KAI5541573.1 hypothetical protein TVAGG3_0054990 [Trichomonas vaginalis G3]|eukprot:XP_001299220.1 hypothetical protein [Trichomonas vaginalis G3]